MTASRPRNTHERNLERHLGEIAGPSPQQRNLPENGADPDAAGRLAREAVLREATRRAQRIPGSELH